MEQDNFWTRYFAAQDSGLNHEWCLKVAYNEVTLEDALGYMDMDDESEFDPNFSMVGDDIDDDDYDDDCIPW